MSTSIPHYSAFIGLGSNLGDRSANLRAAVRLLRAADGIDELIISPVYVTRAVGPAGPGDFLNAVARVTTRLAPRDLLRTTRAIERALGRGVDRAGPRTIDLDILLFDDMKLDTVSLVIPHPRMHERAFVLVPLADLAPEVRHPVLGQTIRELLARLPDTGEIGGRSEDIV